VRQELLDPLEPELAGMLNVEWPSCSTAIPLRIRQSMSGRASERDWQVSPGNAAGFRPR
jgi:hypothetical protein